MRMIDADALREQLVWCKEQAGRFDTFWDDVIERVDSIPTADAVSVVRCEDCKNWIPGIITEKDEFIPPKCGKYQQMVGHNCFDFCSLVERR